MNSFSLRNRILAVAGVLVIAMTVILVVGVQALSNFEERVHGFADQDVSSVELMLNIDRDAYQAQLALGQALFSEDAAARDGLLTDYAENRDQTGERPCRGRIPGGPP